MGIAPLADATPAPPTQAGISYRRHVDGLRAVAVLAVVAFHAGVPFLPGGYVGVDVFFVISGFLNTGLLLREFETRADISLIGFYERRVRRLAPALLLVLVVTLVLGAVFLVPIGGEQQGLAKSAIATVLLASNIWLAHATGGYFDAPAASQPLLHTWSLSVEEQFYLVWPSLLLLATRWASRRDREPARVMALVLAVVGLASLGLSIASTPTHPDFAFYGAPTRAWEFAIGGLAFYVVSRRSTPLPWSQVLSWAGLAAILWSCASFSETATPFPGWRAGIPALGAALVILGGEHDAKGLCTRMLSWQPMVFVGLISYSLYLWHWPLLVVARLDSLGEIGPWGIAGICLLSFVLAWLTYRFVENPLRHRRIALMATRRSTFATGVAGSVGVILLAAGLGAWAHVGWRGDGAQASLQTALAGMRKSRTTCGQDRPYSRTLRNEQGCDLATANGKPSILLWGDSHADAMAAMVDAAARQRGIRMRLRYSPECPPLPGFSTVLAGVQFPRGSGEDGGCAAYNADVLAEALRLKHDGLATVVLEAHWPAYVGTPEALHSASTSLMRTVSQLRQVGLHVVLVAPGVDQPHEVPACLAREPAELCETTRVAAQANRQAAFAMLQRAARMEGVRLLDPMLALCDRDVCPAVSANAVLYSDRHHLTVAGAMRLLPVFLPMLESGVPAAKVASGARP